MSKAITKLPHIETIPYVAEAVTLQRSLRGQLDGVLKQKAEILAKLAEPPDSLTNTTRAKATALLAGSPLVLAERTKLRADYAAACEQQRILTMAVEMQGRESERQKSRAAEEFRHVRLREVGQHVETLCERLEETRQCDAAILALADTYKALGWPDERVPTFAHVSNSEASPDGRQLHREDCVAAGFIEHEPA